MGNMSEFAKLWGATSVSALGDGVTLAAGPLLAATLTRDPVQIAGLMVAQQLPWTVLALPSGAIVDRMNRRRLMTVASVVRMCALGALGLAVATGHATLPLLYLIFLLVGCAGVLYENASVAMIPETAARIGLDRANGRMIATRTLGQSLLGPPLAGWLFAIAAWTPFVLDALAFVLVTALCLALSAAIGQAPAVRATFRAAIAEGLRFLLGHRVLRTLAITVAIENVLLGAVTSILVLIAQQRLGVGPIGYGLLLSASAVGGVAGGLVAGRFVGWFGGGTVLRVGLVLEALCYVGLAVTRNVWLAGVIVGVLGLHLVTFSTINATLRQSLPPADMIGRVHSAYRLLSSGGLLAGAALGGVCARLLGLTSPFWLGAAGVAVLAVCTWRVLSNEIMATSAPAR